MGFWGTFFTVLFAHFVYDLITGSMEESDQYGLLAQLVAHRTFNPLVPGSSPGWPTIWSFMNLSSLVNIIIAFVTITLVIIFTKANIDYLLGEKSMIEFLIDVATLGLAIFVGSVAFDWWRKNHR